MATSCSGAGQMRDHERPRGPRRRRRRVGGGSSLGGVVASNRLPLAPGRAIAPSPSRSLAVALPIHVFVFFISVFALLSWLDPSIAEATSSAPAAFVPRSRRRTLAAAGGAGARAPTVLVGTVADALTATPRPQHHRAPAHARPRAPLTLSAAAKGFGASSSSSPKKSKKVKTKKKDRKKRSTNNPYVKSESDRLLAELAASSSESILGRTVASCPPSEDQFWDMVPSLIASKFPSATDSELERVAGFLSYALDPAEAKLDGDLVEDEWRPNGIDEVHAYMPGLGPRQPFLDTSRVELCRKLEENYDVILEEYKALVDDMERRGSRSKVKFQSVTSMNYESGWKTLVLFYNGHRIPDFPYHLCPVTTSILETVPIAGRIAGFNRQKPNTGIPKHSDGNNMWLTCQMGVKVPRGNKAFIRVGPETRRWENGRCLLYDTTYEHETFNESEDEERVVLHVDFFNFLSMTALEVEVMQYIYELREKFMKAEGVAKVGAQIL